MSRDLPLHPIRAIGAKGVRLDFKTSSGSVTILVCETCRDAAGTAEGVKPGAVLGDATRALAAGRPGVTVETVACLGNCKRRLSAALVLDGGWSYVFGDLATDSAADLVAGADLFLTATDGILPWRGRPDSLKRGMVARLPPLPLSVSKEPA